MLNKTTLEELSKQLQLAAETNAGFEANRTLDEEDAYVIQKLVAASTDGKPKVWKTGFLSTGAVFCAPIAASQCKFGPANFSAQNFPATYVEGELAFRLNRVFEAGRSYSDDDILQSINAVSVAIEVLDSRIKNWMEAGEFWHLADRQLNGALALGGEVLDCKGVDYATQAVQLYVNGELVVDDVGSHPQRDPTTLLAGFVRQLTSRGYTFLPGSWVTTGTWTGLSAVKPGDEVLCIFQGLGQASLRL